MLSEHHVEVRQIVLATGNMTRKGYGFSKGMDLGARRESPREMV